MKASLRSWNETQVIDPNTNALRWSAKKEDPDTSVASQINLLNDFKFPELRQEVGSFRQRKFIAKRIKVRWSRQANKKTVSAFRPEISDIHSNCMRLLWLKSSEQCRITNYFEH